MRLLLLLIAPALLLGACATTPDGLRPALGVNDGDEGGSAYGLFLAGQAALNDGDSAHAADLFERAEARGVDPAITQERAFTAALLAGDIPRAVKLSPSGDAVSPGMERMGLLVQAVDLMAAGKGKAAAGIFAKDDIGFPHKAARALLAPWASAQAGDIDGSIVRPEAGGDKIVEAFGQLGQAHLFERARRYDEAETDFKALLAGPAAGPIFQLAYGGFLERRGRRAEALAVYDAGLAANPNEPGLVRARARAAAGKTAPAAPTLREGAGQAMLAASAGMIAARQQQLGLAYLRLVLRLDPGRDEAWVLIGDVLADGGETEAARAAYQRLKPGEPDYVAARSKIAWTYQRAEQPETALKIARETAAGGDPDAKLVLADLLRANDRYEESLALLSDVLARRPDDWRLLYGRAVVLERLNRWPEAQIDLLAALKLRPDEPELLNYLGYSWIDRNERVDEGIAMITKAVAANPNSAAMIDSLGWGYYRKGDLEKARLQLERAVELEPGDPEINNHLGDLYWRAGRRLEARFQWDRVLTLEPDAKIKANVEAKLKNGLGPDGRPVEAPRLAGS